MCFLLFCRILSRVGNEMDSWARKGCDYKWGVRGEGAFGNGFDDRRFQRRGNIATWIFLLGLLFPVLGFIGMLR
jgi:hypothetical protein